MSGSRALTEWWLDEVKQSQSELSTAARDWRNFDFSFPAASSCPLLSSTSSMRRSVPIRAIAQTLESSAPTSAKATSSAASAAASTSRPSSTSERVLSLASSSTPDASSARARSTRRSRAPLSVRFDGYFDSLRALEPARNRHSFERESDAGTRGNALRDFFRELSLPVGVRTPERLWTAYVALAGNDGNSDAKGSSSVHELQLIHHRMLLRAIAPVRSGRLDRSWINPAVSSKASGASRLQSQDGLDGRISGSLGGPLVRYRPPESFHSGAHNAQAVSEYIRRVWVVLGHMHQAVRGHQQIQSHLGGQADTMSFPAIEDCNHILYQLAVSGDIDAAEKIWSLLDELPRGSMSSPQPHGQFAASAFTFTTLPRPVPNKRSYHAMMLCLTRGLDISLQKLQATHNKMLRYDHFARRLGQSRHDALKRDDVSPEARRACWQAATRAIALVQEMWSRSIEPDSFTYDLALRTLRKAGHLSGIKLLIESGYGISLDHPDTAPAEASTSAKQQLSVHTLNTIIMTLGEQRTVSEMVSAYETLSRPLVRSVTLTTSFAETASQSRDRLFAIDWDALLNRPIKEVGDLEPPDKSVPDVFQYKAIGAPLPNTTTITRMIQLCTNMPKQARLPPDGDRSLSEELSPSKSRRLRSTPAPHSSEREAHLRKTGAYLPIAKYLLLEAQEIYEAEVMHSRAGLGVDLPATDLATFMPRYAAPRLVPNSHMLRPLLARSFDRRVTGSHAHGLGVWCERWIAQSVFALQKELQTLQQAVDLWREYALGSEQAEEVAPDRTASRHRVQDTVTHKFTVLTRALTEQSDRVQQEVSDLSSLREEFVQRRRRANERKRERIVRRHLRKVSTLEKAEAERLRRETIARNEIEAKETEKKRRKREKELRAEEEAKRVIEESTVLAAV